MPGNYIVALESMASALWSRRGTFIGIRQETDMCFFLV